VIQKASSREARRDTSLAARRKISESWKATIHRRQRLQQHTAQTAGCRLPDVELVIRNSQKKISPAKVGETVARYLHFVNQSHRQPLEIIRILPSGMLKFERS